ncbi:cytochrome c oxidase, subunit VIb [Dichomitus squalens]|uniref:Cytochrome c oxidase, subunit VIb n=1 Tax=Dichomitus squalens TaxID=114155 RepID=A0A4Q9M5N0_9APHY|nr:cytochrome c oxidase, subunit VIb [Dichomitus squalens]
MSDLSSKYVLQTAGFDARFPNQNQTRHCFQNYTDYFKCIAAKGEDYAPCKQFKRAYNSLCPSSHHTLSSHINHLVASVAALKTNGRIAKWDEQRENGTFPASLEP